MADLKIGSSCTEDQAMDLAIQEALKGSGFVSPNPPVGCTILDKDDCLLAVGYHSRLGGPHAEIDALSKVKDPSSLIGAKVYVTLEPCAHQGRTPPCADQLASLPIKKVIYGLVDPNPKVSGQGIAKLKASGKEVTEYSGNKDQLEELAEFFLHNHRHQRAFLAVKVATSLDGQIGLASGESQWITNEASRLQVQYLRGCYDAVMIGRHTFERDNPSLNSRHPQFKDRMNRVLVLDPICRAVDKIPESNLLKVRSAENVIWVVREGTDLPVPKGITVWHEPWTAGQGFDLQQLTVRCYREGISSVLVEGGGHLISRLLKQKAVNRWYQFMAPKIIGASGGMPVTRDWRINSLSEAPQLTKIRWQNFDDDILVTGRL